MRKKLIKIPYYLSIAYKVAETSDYGRFRLGAVIVKNNRIISMGTNSHRSHPLQKKYTTRPHLEARRHAEVHALSLCKAYDINNADAYIGRLTMNGSVGNSRPCCGCEAALKDFNIKRIFYFADGEFFSEILS